MHSFERFESEVRCYSRSFPTVFARAQGCCMFDEKGRRFIDFLAGAGSLNYGHNNPNIKKAVLDYLINDGIVHGLDLATTAKRAFIERFQSVILQPRAYEYKLQFTGPTGANGIEAALKLARKATGRCGVMAFTGGYHGLSSGALAVTANRYYRKEVWAPRLNVAFMPFDSYDRSVDSLSYLRRVLSDNSSGIDLPAAIILETLQAEGGVNVASDNWLRSLQAICRDLGILMIVDDIQAGNGRTGPFFSFERAQLSPDIVVLSKSIGGIGLPMTLVLMKPSLDCWQPGEHTGTFRGNNLAFVAGTEALAYWLNDSFTKRVVELGVRVQNTLDDLVHKYSEVSVTCRGLGLIWGLEVRNSRLASQIQRTAFEHGLLVELCGANGNVLKILPPLTIEESTLDEGLSILGMAVRDSAAVVGPLQRP